MKKTPSLLTNKKVNGNWKKNISHGEKASSEEKFGSDTWNNFKRPQS